MRQVTFGGKLSKLPSYEIIRIRYDKIDMKKNYELLRNRKTILNFLQKQSNSIPFIFIRI